MQQAGGSIRKQPQARRIGGESSGLMEMPARAPVADSNSSDVHANTRAMEAGGAGSAVSMRQPAFPIQVGIWSVQETFASAHSSAFPTYRPISAWLTAQDT